MNNFSETISFFLKDKKPNHLAGFVAELPEHIESKEELLNILSSKLKFPDYFGHNWDALDECLNNLEWLSAKTITIIHNSFPKLNENDSKIYIDILLNASVTQRSEQNNVLNVLFPEKDRLEIERLVNQD
jgi:RNAse (barnase) inhibitor barstar